MKIEKRNCKYHGLTDFVKRNNGRFRCKKCAVEAVQRRRNDLKLLAIEYKGGKCEICGYNKCVSAMDFHHLDPSNKDFSISAKGYTRSWEKVKEELDKCIMVCANCHRELHHPERITNNVDLLEKNNMTKEETKICKKCGKIIGKGRSELCCPCLNIEKIKYMPSKEELFILINEKSFCEIGRIYGVSDNAIRKWCKKYHLPSTKKELNIIANCDRR